MIKILIADDQAIVREGLKRILHDEFDDVMFSEEQDAEEALQQIRTQDFDLVMMDISVRGGRTGIDTLIQMKQLKPNVPVLVLSMYHEDEDAVRALRAGAAGYVSKEIAADELVKAVRRALAGHKYISDELAEVLVFKIQSGARKPAHGSLSNREYEVMRMTATGKTPKQIGDELALSVKTVSTYRMRIREKIGLHTNGEMILYAIRNGLVVG